jgi:gluconolactonase
VYRVDPKDGKIRPSSPISAPNRLAFSPDEKILYVVGVGATPRMIDAYDVIDDGTGLANQRGAISADDKGSADELRVDVDGNLWCGWGTGEGLDAVSIFNPRGKLIDRDPSDFTSVSSGSQ